MQDEPPASGFNSAIAWLRDNDVSTGTIASLFGHNQGWIRQLAYRGRMQTRVYVHPVLVAPVEREFDLGAGPPASLRGLIGIRPHGDYVIMTRKEKRWLDTLEAAFEVLRDGFYNEARGGAGIERFRALLMQIGYPANYRRIRLMGRVYFQIAVFYIHIGEIASGLDYAYRSFHLFWFSFHEGNQQQDVKWMAHAAQVIAQGYVLALQPEDAAFYLTLQRNLLEFVKAAPPAENFRLRGIIRIQQQEDDAARREISNAYDLIKRDCQDLGLPAPSGIPMLNVLQNSYFLAQDWESAVRQFEYLHSILPENHILIPMNLNWAIACAFRTGSSNAWQTAQRLLDRHRGAGIGYGHQATILRLLSITPYLPSRLHPAWVRRALFENAFRHR